MEIKHVIPYRVIGQGVENTEADNARDYALVIRLLSAKLSVRYGLKYPAAFVDNVLIALEWVDERRAA